MFRSHRSNQSQEEKVDEGGWSDPAGFHLIPLPFADDMRAAPIEGAYRGEFLADVSLVGP
jgi:hypothetical protein